MPDLRQLDVEGDKMNMMKFENRFGYIPALFVSGSSVVSIFIAIAIIISIIIIAPPGMV